MVEAKSDGVIDPEGDENDANIVDLLRGGWNVAHGEEEKKTGSKSGD